MGEGLKQIKAPCPSFVSCDRQLTAVLDLDPEQPGNTFLCYWRARSVSDRQVKPDWIPAMYATLDHCPDCGTYLPDFVRIYPSGGKHFYGLDREEMRMRMVGELGPGPRYPLPETPGTGGTYFGG